MSESLNVWMNGELVGAWTVARGAHSLSYAASWLKSDKVRSLSLSLPITSAMEIRGDVVANFFDNLLPDNDRIRARLSRRFKTKKTDAFSLLEAVGRDCVGAIQLLPQGATPDGWDRIDCVPQTDSQIAEILKEVTQGNVDGNEIDSFRISLAGAQEKTAFVRAGSSWCKPNGATPTTHIFKLPLGIIGGSRRVDLSDSVPNEWLCAQIVRELGLPVANSEIKRFGDQTVLVVERFDRALMGRNQWIARLPQEDFCQALGLPPNKKYEADGGPGMQTCLRLLSGSADAKVDRMAFQLTQLCFWLLAAGDGHAKNYSVFLSPGGSYAMTPLYDIISFWPFFGESADKLSWRKAGLAMAMRSKSAHYHFSKIHTRHWYGLAMKNGGSEVWAAMLGLVDQVEPALQAIESRLDASFPDLTWKLIAQGLRSQVELFRQGLKHLD